LFASKVVVSIASLGLLSLAFTSTPTLAATHSSNAAIHTVYLPNVPMKAGTLGSTNAAAIASNSANASTTPVEKNTVTITDASVNGSAIQLSGYVTNASGTQTPFHLVGTLGQGTANGEVFANVSDTTGNFQVVRFEIDSEPSHDMWYNATAADSSTVPYMALYLEQSGTRNMTFAEGSAASFLGAANVETIYSNVASYAKAPIRDQLWLEAAFQPDSQTRSVKPSSATLSASPSTTYAYPHSQEVIYSEGFNFAGYYASDSIELMEYWDQPNGTGGNQTAELQVAGFTWAEYTSESGTYIQTLTNQFTGWEIGAGGSGSTGNVGIKYYIPQPLGIINTVGGAEWTINNGVSLSWGLGYSIPDSPIEFNLNVGSIKTGSTTSTSASQLDQDDLLGHEADFFFNGDSNNYLQAIGQNVTATFTIELPSPSSVTSETATIQFCYEPYESLYPRSTGGEGQSYGNMTDPYSWTLNPNNN